ncbi:GNAT family N-acetyltransferase [Chelatococcus sp. GCM10030263]|uniref:GNAT family N-acetyltransferase n=1 Tax=Chelatococcus sp. GCM10030263 TaxID=3273387 RepID=UPI0036200060
MPFLWSRTSPIRQVTPVEFSRLCDAFQQDLIEWFVLGARSQEQLKWNNRIAAALALSKFSFGSDYFTCVIGRKPVGIAAVTRTDGCYIDIGLLATHPGQQGAGSILIEHIVNFWPPQSFHLELAPLSDARPFYLRLGFETLGSRDMRLDVTKSPQWVRLGGKWRLAAYVHLPFYAAVVDAVPAAP